jgi:23S rRNA pseudouridine1911/1915/1917 synthase
MPNYCNIVKENLPKGIRLDVYLAEYLHLLSRSQLKARGLGGTVNGKKAKLSSLVKHGDKLELFWNEAEALALVPQDIPLDIVYEDERSVVVNKAQGMVVHPGAGNRQGTLANALYFRRLQYSGALAEGLRPGIVHRLDKDTSGLIIAAYNEASHAFLAEQFKAGKVKKTYIAMVKGNLETKKGRVETFIARDPKDRKRFAVLSRGKTALTLYREIKSWPGYSLVLLRPKTGRTHQLRVHMRYLGHPIIGDAVYGSKDSVSDASLMLHAKKLEIMLPGEDSPRVFSLPLPERFITMIRKLEK